MFMLWIGDNFRFWNDVFVNLKLLRILNFSWDKFVRFLNGFVNVNFEKMLIFRYLSEWILESCIFGYFKFWKLFWWIWRILSLFRLENVFVLILFFLRNVNERFKLYKFFNL